MMRKSLVGAAALTAGAIGGAVLGYLAERTVVSPTGPGQLPAGDTLDHLDNLAVRAADGTGLAVSASGPADAPRIVMIHGLSLAQEIWTAQRAALRDRYRVVTYDMRGHGDSDDAASGDYSASGIGSDLVAVLDEFGGRSIVVGHSMGGMALLGALGDRPDLLDDRIAGVVLVNSAASAILFGLGNGSLLAGVAFLRERARSSLLGRIVYGGLAEDGTFRGNDLATVVTRMIGVGANSDPAAVEVVRRLVLASRPQVAGEMWRTASTIDQLSVARELRVPALVIGGGRDRVLPPRHSRKLASTIPDAQLLLLPEVGHVSMLERPDQVSDAIAGFADRVLEDPAG